MNFLTENLFYEQALYKKITIVLISILFFFNQKSNGQTRTIQGRIISEDLEVLPMVRIQNIDTILLGETDMEGKFKINIPKETDKLLMSWLGMEWTTIKLQNTCDTIEIIIMVDAIYDFMSSRKIDRLRLKRFNKLKELHLDAIKKKLFNKEILCYSREFEPDKPNLDEIQKQINKTNKQIKKTFENLAIGDTIRIPYSICKECGKAKKTKLSFYSYLIDEKNYDCIIKGVIINKNKRKKGYNLKYRVINCDKCKHNFIIFDEKDMVVNAVFEHNMRYFKILNK